MESCLIVCCGCFIDETRTNSPVFLVAKGCSSDYATAFLAGGHSYQWDLVVYTELEIPRKQSQNRVESNISIYGVAYQILLSILHRLPKN